MNHETILVNLCENQNPVKVEWYYLEPTLRQVTIVNHLFICHKVSNNFTSDDKGTIHKLNPCGVSNHVKNENTYLAVAGVDEGIKDLFLLSNA